jgi:hypothetical protein
MKELGSTHHSQLPQTNHNYIQTTPILLFIMVKLLNLSVAAIALLAPIAEASDCTAGLRYCGYVLLRVGKHRSLARWGL